MAVVPDPKRLLLPDPDAIPSVLHDKFYPIFGFTLGLTAVLASRHMYRRPLLSGIQQHFLCSIIGGVVGKVLYDRNEAYNADKDAMYRHYISLHPEDFPMPKRVKVGEMFDSWTPIR